jgi:hypothetical protein
MIVLIKRIAKIKYIQMKRIMFRSLAMSFRLISKGWEMLRELSCIDAGHAIHLLDFLDITKLFGSQQLAVVGVANTPC